MPSRRLLAAVLCSILIFTAHARAGEWYESYQEGMKALAQGQPSRALSLLEQAAGQRPQPGRNVITYGTNVVERYYPYLHLAEAYVQVRDLAGARSALKRSESWGREPAEERRRLTAQVEELAARLAAPPPAAIPVRPSPMPRETPAEIVVAPTAAPAAVPTAPAAPATPAPADSAPAVPHGAPTPRATVQAPLPRHDAPAAPTGSLEVVSQPPGASVYLDDTLIGATDAEWGRLGAIGITPGRHRVRLVLAGHNEIAEDVDVSAGGRADFRRRLTPTAAPDYGRFALLGGAVLVVLALAFRALRRRGGAAAVTPVSAPTFDPEGPTPFRSTPPGMSSPGVHRDAGGVEHFGEYRLVQPLGRGGMASVYKAERRGEVCALKRPLLAFLEEPEFLERFQREAEIGRTLHHPNIVRILERGEVEQVPFFTMELIAGETLQEQVQRVGALDPRLATRIVVQIAEALDYAHLKGIVHRDLKPSNVMVMPDGTARVMDFGIARARRFEGLTVTGSFLGSPEYAAPEAIEGRNTDARSDLYSLGVIFYEVLTGRRPFTADTPFAVLRKHVAEPPPPPTSLRPGLPPELERIVLRLLSKSPAQRHASAEDLVLELRDFLNQAA